MSAPEKVRLKRKRTEDPPEALLLTRAQDIANGTPQKRIRYVIENAVQSSRKRSRSPTKSVASRLFHLKRLCTAAPNSDDIRETVPTVEETSRHTVQLADPKSVTVPAETPQVKPAQPLKRPGKGSVTKIIENAPTTNAGESKDLASLADSMHQFALQEVAKPAKPAVVSKPRMSPSQSKNRHERRMASAQAATPQRSADAMDVDGEFVYDVYVLSTAGSEDVEMTGDVGLIVIGEQDEDYWHELIAQGEIEEQEHSDEDENAEDHYAADYPEDELASDDQFDRDAYRYRGGAGSDDEQWDHRDDSDDDDNDVYDGEVGFGNGVSMVRRWEADLGMRGAAHYDYD